MDTKIYYVLLDYDGWNVFTTDAGEGFWGMAHNEPFYYTTTCRDNAIGMCKILRQRNIQ